MPAERHVVALGARPVHAAGGVDAVVGDAAVVARAPGGHPTPLGEGVVGRGPAGEQLVAAAPALGQVEEDVEVGAGLARRLDRGPDAGHAALAVRERAVLLAPDGGGQHHVGQRRRRCLEAVLHDEQVEAAQGVLEHLAVGERHRRVGGDDPQALDVARHHRVDDVGVGLAPGRGQAGLVDAPQAGQLGPGRRVVVAPVAGHRGGEARLAGAHGVALAR